MGMDVLYGTHFIGGFIDEKGYKNTWVEGKVDQWARVIGTHLMLIISMSKELRTA